LNTGRDTFVGDFAHSNAQSLAAGASYTNSATFPLPPGIGGSAANPQTFYVYVIADPSGALSTISRDNDASCDFFGTRAYEDATNNQAAQTLPVIYREPDLQVTNLLVPATEPHSGDTISLSWTVTNTGNRDTREGYWTDRVYLSRDPSLDAGDTELGELNHYTILKTGDHYTESLTVRLPDDIGGDYYVLVFTDSNTRGTIDVPGLGVAGNSIGSVPEFQGEGNNITPAFMPVSPTPPPDLQVTSVIAPGPDPTLPGHVLTGQSFTVNYTVANKGGGDTPDLQANWDDYVYLSRDRFLSDSDIFFGAKEHTGGLKAGASYPGTITFQAPRGLTGPWYVFVFTDPPTPYAVRGDVYEGDNEGDNATPTVIPLIIDQPPPADLVVSTITIPGSAMAGDSVEIKWTVKNVGVNPASGSWTDAAYLSADANWDINDKPIGKFSYSGTLQPGQTYTDTLDASLPPATPGSYRVIVRTDLFDAVLESSELNNTTPSADVLNVTVPALQLGVPFSTTLDPGQDRLYQVTVPDGDTLRVDLTSSTSTAANELFLRHQALPTASTYDTAYQGALQANKYAVIPSTTVGVYYILIHGQAEPGAHTPVTLLASVLPFGITDVVPDTGGDSRYVTTTILGAQFDPQAIVKLVRPGFAEFEPVSYQVMDKTRIVAVFDFTGAPHGLYDVEVINPDGQVALAPYRYLVEQALPPDVTVALGGPRVVWAGQSGLYGFTLTSRTNVDLPYVYFQYGVPGLPLNEGVPYLGLTTSLSGSAKVAGVPWASIVASADTNGQELASGYVLDFADRSNATLSFNVQTYPNGLPSGAYTENPGVTAFTFNIMAAATPLTPEEYVAQQTLFAATLRTNILADPTASTSLQALASDAATWTNLYLTALTQAGLLRPQDDPPAVHDDPVLVSLQTTLAAGILAGPAGKQIITNGNLVDFFNQVEKWYGNDSAKVSPYIGTGNDTTSPDDATTYLLASPPPASDFNLGTTAPTHYEGFNVYVPWANDWDADEHPGRSDSDETHPENPNFLNVQAPNFAPFFTGTGRSGQASINGPLAYGPQQYVPLGQPLPFTVQFQNGAGASSTVGQVRVVEQLDPNIDPRTFRLGDLQLGNLQVHLPNSVGSFQGDFDFTQSKGFILRVSAGLDTTTDTAAWLLQAIDPLTGEVITDPTRGLLAPDNAAGAGRGFVTYTAQPKAGLSSGAQISARARVEFNTTAPLETPTVTYTVDGSAPTTTLTASAVTQGGGDYNLQWTSQDDSAGSGVKSITVYVSRDGGSWSIWLSQTTATAGIYNGQAGHSYQFLALATDNAGNQEKPPVGTAVPDDDAQVNLGSLPTVSGTSQDLGTPPPPATTPSANALFTQAQQGIPSPTPPSHLSEFHSVLAPIVAQSFVTGIGQSQPDIGPIAILPLPGGSVLASGGPARNQLFLFSAAGGKAGTPVATLSEPIYDMALDASGFIWATTGGGSLLELDPKTFAVLGQFGEALTQSLAIQPGTGLIYVSSGDGIAIFDPATRKFTHLSDIRVGSLAFAPDGTLWAATWPHNQGQVIRLTGTPVAPQLMFQFDADVDSIAFGVPGSKLDGLLFVSHTNEAVPGAGTELTMIDLATLKQVALATGGTRGDEIKTTADGRLLLSQSHQIDVLGPVTAPLVASVSPPPGADVALPLGSVSVTFDRDMLADDAFDPGSVLNPDNYHLQGDSAGFAPVRAVAYDPASRTAVLNFDAFASDHYQLRVLTNLRSQDGINLAQEFDSDFTATTDLSSVISLQFDLARSDRTTGTVSFDVTITNTTSHKLLLPVVLHLTPVNQFPGEPEGNQGRAPDGSWLIDLSGDLPANGILDAGQSSSGRTITIDASNGRPVAFDTSVTGVPAGNSAPVFLSYPVTSATVGQLYDYSAVGFDEDGNGLTYVLTRGPAGMAVDPATGRVTWTPTVTSPAFAAVTLQVYDSAGTPATQVFIVAINGVNLPPAFNSLTSQVSGKEGMPLTISVQAADPDIDPLVFWADNLPPGAEFDPARQALVWTPDYHSAGTYPNVRFVVSDGLHQVSQDVTVVIAPNPQPPTLLQPADVIGREGDLIQVQLQASDASGAVLTYSSAQLPPGAILDPHSGLFVWTPDNTQHGIYKVPLTVTNGRASTTQTANLVVLNVNAAPVFQNLNSFQVLQNQTMQFRALALDPDHPGFVPPTRNADGTLTSGGGSPTSVRYTVNGLPAGATFDADTLLLTWTPTFDQVGPFPVTFTATDNGDGTGAPQSTSQTVTVIVLPVNRPPQIPAIPYQTVKGGAPSDLTVTAPDPDHDAVKLSATGLPEFVTFADNGNATGTFHFAPGATDGGNYTITLQATDDGKGGQTAVLSAQQSFVLTVQAPPPPPHLDFVGDKAAVVGQPVQFILHAEDAAQLPLSFTGTGLPVSASITKTIYGQAIVTWMPTAADAGTYPVIFQVSDNGNGDAGKVGSDQQAMKIVVRATDQAPLVASIEDPTVTAGKTLVVTPAGSDSDGDSLTWTATNLPAGAAFDPVHGVLTWATTLAQAGTYANITLTAGDGHLSAARTFTIHVIPVNQPPVLIPMAPQSGRETTLLRFTLTAIDPDFDKLTFAALAPLPTGALLNVQTGEVDWTPTYEQAGAYTFRLGVKDPGGLGASLDVSVTIDNVDRTPALLPVPSHSALLGQPLHIVVSGSDPDAGTGLTYSATGLPDGATFDATSGAFGWTPGATQAGDYPVTFSVSAGELSASQTTVIHALLTSQAPAVTVELTPSFPAVPGQQVIVHVSASGASAITHLTLTADGQPLTLDAQGRLSFTAGAPGRLQLVATATDVD
jgi:CARDB/Putative Ig domain